MGSDLNGEDKRIRILREEKPAKAVLSLGVPLIMGMIIMVLYNLVDTYFIGRTGNDYQLAAVNLAYPVMMVMVALSNMTGTGASSLMARSMGKKDIPLAEKTLTQGFLLSAAVSLAVSAAGLFFLQDITRVLGAREYSKGFTADYAGVLFLGSIFVMGNYTLGQFLRGEGSVRYSIIGMIVGTAVNILLDPLFIFTFSMEIKGAAVATVLGNAAGAAASVFLYLSGKTLLRPRVKYLIPDYKVISEILYVGIPATLETLLTSAAYVVNNNLAVGYGELTVAAVGIAQKIMTLGNYIYQGFASGTQPVMGYNYGAENYDRMLAVLKAGIMVTSVTELMIMGVYGFFAPVLVGIFTENAEVIKTGCTALRAIMWILPFVGATSMSRMSFQAMGKPLHAFLITLIRQLVLYIPLLVFFNRAFHFRGLIWAQPVTEAVMMAVSVTLLVSLINRKKKEKGLREAFLDN